MVIGLPTLKYKSKQFRNKVDTVFTLCSEFIDVAVQFKDSQDGPLNHFVAYVYYVFTGVIFM